MLERATFIINSGDFTEGFYIVVVKTPKECGTMTDDDIDVDDIDIPENQIKITIKENNPLSNYLISIGIVSGGYIVVFAMSLLMVKTAMNIKKTQEFKEMFGKFSAVDGLRHSMNETSVAISDTNEQKEDCTAGWLKKRKTDKTVNDLCTCDQMDHPSQNSSVFVRNQLHWIILITSSMFYYLPSIQMVMHSSNLYKDTGDQDYCYYNSLCQMPMGTLRDFNHVFSNLGYAVLGILFICVVHQRQKISKLLDKKNGIPRNYSLFYSMGLSLIGISVMSSCYHICPTNVTFQFDTTYMYMMAFFMFLKIYQNRHPDLVCDGFKGFLFIGICIGLEVIIPPN